MEFSRIRFTIIALVSILLVTIFGSASSFAATIGEKLTSNDQIGWTRIEDSNENIQYTGTWINNTYRDYSGGTAHNTPYNPNENSHQIVKFKFEGTKFRIISQTTDGFAKNILVTIDGITDTTFSEYNESIHGSDGCNKLVYEKTGLDNKQHTIILTKESVGTFQLDAIEIDLTGRMIDINSPEVPTMQLAVLLNEDETVQLSTSFNLDNNKKYSWNSTNEAVATVDANGKVTALTEGTVDIYAESADGTFKECIPVKVVEGIADELRLAVHLKSGEKAKLYLTDEPSHVTWKSMDDSTVTVSADGQITGVKKGLAIVQAELDGETYQIYVRING